jgi:hypothetical protein
MSSDGYWLARLRALQDRLQEHLSGVPEEGIAGSADYRRGFDSGRRVAYERSLLMIGALRREWAVERAREAGGRSPETPPAPRSVRIRPQ